LLDEELTIRILGKALAPHLRDNVMARFPTAINVTPYWGGVFEEAIISARQADGATNVEWAGWPAA
jgi:hypothetical protein